MVSRNLYLCSKAALMCITFAHVIQIRYGCKEQTIKNVYV